MRTIQLLLLSLLTNLIQAQEKPDLEVDYFGNKDVLFSITSNYIRKSIRNEIIQYFNSDIVKHYYQYSEKIDKRKSDSYALNILKDYFYIDTSRVVIYSSYDSLFVDNFKVDSFEIPVKFNLKEFNFENRIIIKYKRPLFDTINLSFIPKYLLRNDTCDFISKEKVYEVAKVLNITNIDYPNIELKYDKIRDEYYWSIPIFNDSSKMKGRYIKIPAILVLDDKQGWQTIIYRN